MDGKCCHCKTRLAEKCGEVAFEYKGMKIRAFRCGSECSECVKEHKIEEIEKIPAGVVTPCPGDLPKIDWEKYLQIDKGDREYHGGPFDQTTILLIDLGILRYDTADDYWVVFGCGMNLGPLIPLSGGMAFAREIDAVEYSQAKYPKAMYRVSVVHQTKSTLVNR